MSRKASVLSDSKSLWQGISPLIILQKMQTAILLRVSNWARLNADYVLFWRKCSG
jgi:hypothetical protein